MSLAAVAATLFVLGATVVVQQQSSESEVARIADQLHAPSNWSAVSWSSKPDRLFCFSGGCPSATRRWSVPGDLSTAEFTGTYLQSGWPLRLEHDCEPAPTGQVGRRSCWASGEVEGWPVQLVLQPSLAQPGTGEVVLFVN